MQNVPQIVRERLKAEVSANHPDANVLTGFAERSLARHERASVMDHLARCNACREIVALALPETAAGQQVIVPARRGWFSWPTFRWAFVTAALAVIAVGALEYQKHSRPEPSAMVAKRVMAEPMAADSERRASEQTPAPALPVEHKKDSGASSTMMVRELKARPNAPRTTSPMPQASAGSGAGRGLEIHGATAANAFQVQQQNPALGEPFPPSARAKEPGAAVAADTNVPSSSEMVEVETQRVEVAPSTDKKIAQAVPSPMFDRYSGAIDKAKPAITAAQDVNAPASPRWSISAAGSLQRSYDQGNTWQDVDVNAAQSPMAATTLEITAKNKFSRMQKAPSSPAPQLMFRAVTANGSDVWAGGSNGALYHSTDAGNHWIRVTPSSAGTVLSGDIVGVDFPSPQNGSISTSNGEVWTTGDGGQSWQKQ